MDAQTAHAIRETFFAAAGRKSACKALHAHFHAYDILRRICRARTCSKKRSIAGYRPITPKEGQTRAPPCIVRRDQPTAPHVASERTFTEQRFFNLGARLLNLSHHSPLFHHILLFPIRVAATPEGFPRGESTAPPKCLRHGAQARLKAALFLTNDRQPTAQGSQLTLQASTLSRTMGRGS